MSFRIYWRWRSRRPGRPKTSAEVPALIRRMSRGGLLKLGIDVMPDYCRPAPPLAP
jgi:hypothetical protein